MGILSEIVAYKFGKRRGRTQAQRSFQPVVINDKRNKECSNYYSFCSNYGSCAGLECDND